MNDNAEVDGVDRRTALRRAAMGGVVLWTTPVVLTLDQSIAAASTLNFIGCPRPNEGESPRSLTFQWTGSADHCTVGQASGPALEAVGDDTSTDFGAVDIYATWGTGAAGGAGTALFKNVQDSGPDSFITISNPVQSLTPNAKFYIFPAGSIANEAEAIAAIDGPTQLRYIQVHTSCSQRLVVGDQYCGLTLTGGFV